MRILIILSFLCLPIISYTQIFEDASTLLPANGAMGQSMDVRAVDLDDDTDLDIILANEFQINTILLNTGNGIFEKLSVPAFDQNNHDSEDIAIADFNLDGHLDLLFCSEDDINLGVTEVHELYLGDGQNNFVESPYHFPDSEANAVITADLNNDNIPDVIFGNKGQNRIFINQGDGTFLDETAIRYPTIFRTTQDLLLVDIDQDLDLDLIEGNEDGNILLINNGDGIFSDETALRLPTSAFMETRKISAGDINGDMKPDLFLSNVNFLPNKNPQNALYLNDGSGYFTDITTSNLPNDQDLTLDGIFEDLNADGYPDLVIANVFGGPMKAYLNDGLGYYSNATTEVFGNSLYLRDALGVIAADLDQDSFRDLYICDRNNNTPNKDLFLKRKPAYDATHEIFGSQIITVFPNPIENTFQLKLEPGGRIPKTIKLYSETGQQIEIEMLSLSNNEYEITITTELTPGIFYLNVQFQNGRSTSLQLNYTN